MGDCVKFPSGCMDVESALHIIKHRLNDDSISYDERRRAIERVAMDKNAFVDLAKSDFLKALQFIFQHYDFE